MIILASKDVMPLYMRQKLVSAKEYKECLIDNMAMNFGKELYKRKILKTYEEETVHGDLEITMKLEIDAITAEEFEAATQEVMGQWCKLTNGEELHEVMEMIFQILKIKLYGKV